MNIEIEKIADAGTLEKERVIFKVLADDELGVYGVFKTVKTGDTAISSLTKATYWFPDRQVKKNDLVVLYSRAGINTERKNDDGTTSHFFYWGQPEKIWVDTKDTVVIFKMENWKYKSLA